jgi:hypothetical protein
MMQPSCSPQSIDTSGVALKFVQYIQVLDPSRIAIETFDTRVPGFGPKLPLEYAVFDGVLHVVANLWRVVARLKKVC